MPTVKRPSPSDRERRLLEDARREAAAKRGPAPATPFPKAATAKPAAAAALSPLDGRTVVGWDHPAARRTPPDQAPAAGGNPAAAQGAEAKWSQIAALMEAERAAATEKRQRMKRAATIFVGVVLVIALIVATRLLLKR
jgi:hypothetical protein